MSGIKGANAGEKCARYVHGETKTRLHKIWESMIARCEYEKHPYYEDYGGRGITVCDEWHSYIEFRNWAITHGYNDDLTIDRIKNGKGYDASNCRWATMREQQNNKRSNHIVYLGEIGHTISEWSEILGIGKTTIRMRIESGWSDEDALTVPVRKRTRGYRTSDSCGAKMEGGDTLWEKLDDEPWYDNADRDEIALPIVAAAPTVDAVVVTLCKNCAHKERATVNEKGFLICKASGMEITPDDFCSYGEPKEGTC